MSIFQELTFLRSRTRTSEYLEMVRRAILDGEEIGQSKDVSGVTTIQIGSYRILVFVEKQKSGKYKITDFFKIREGKVFAVDDVDGNKVIVSFYSAVLQSRRFGHPYKY